jgi:COMM domain containing 4
MRFRFCGDSDCPDWVLLEIATLSQLTSVRIKIIVTQILSNLIRGSYNHEKLVKAASDSSAGSLSDIKGAVAAVHFMIVNAAKYDVDDVSLCAEVQQLGLPKENAETIARQFREHKDGLRDIFAMESYRTSRLLSTEWRVDQVIASSNPDTKPSPLVHIKIQLDTRPQDGPLERQTDHADGIRVHDEAFEIPVDKLDVLVHELSAARECIRQVQK